jgi:hypothetical protein
MYFSGFGFFDCLYQAPDINGAALETGYIDSFGVTLQKKVTTTTLAPLEFNNV